MEAESAPFLYKSESEAESCMHRGHPSRCENACSHNPRRRVYYWTHSIFFLVNIVFFFYNNYATLQRDSPAENQGPSSPAREIAKYKVETIKTHLNDYPYAGRPRPEFDHAWSELLNGTMIVVSEHELKKSNKTSIKTPDGRGYVGYIEAFHQLHCVKRLVQMRDPRYYSNLKPEELDDEHFNHCIEVLRTGIMCRADLTLNTYQWDKAKTDKITGLSEGPRMCVDWNHLQSWAKERALSPAEVRHFRQVAP